MKKFLKKSKKTSISFFPPRTVLTFCLALIVVMLSVFNLSLYLFRTQTVPEVAAVYTQDNSEEVKKWKMFLQKNPDYLPGWIVLAELVLSQGKEKEALLYVEKALAIDPNSLEVQELKEKLSKDTKN